MSIEIGPEHIHTDPPRIVDIPVMLNEICEIGKPVVFNETNIPGVTTALVMHPLDWNRIVYVKDPHTALDLALEYFLKKIDQAAERATQRIMGLYPKYPVGPKGDPNPDVPEWVTEAMVRTARRQLESFDRWNERMSRYIVPPVVNPDAPFVWVGDA